MLQSRVLTVLLVVSWLACGIIASLAGFFGFFQSWLWLFLVIPFGLLLLLVWRVSKVGWQYSRFEKILFGILCFIWLLHLLQVFVPETGFDAVWYHLPIAKILDQQQRFVYQPKLYQTANPLFADSIFALGYLLWYELGTKLVAFGFALSLLVVTYQVCRIFLSRSWVLITLICVSLFQVVAWQAGSFYIDISKAMFDLSGLWFLIAGLQEKKQIYQKKYLLLAALVFSASLASKAFSILLFPTIIFGFAVVLGKKHYRNFPALFLTLSLFAVPFYLFTFVHTGSVFFAIQQHTKQLHTFTQSHSLIELFFIRLFVVPKMFIKLFFTRDYTSPLLGLLPVTILLLYRSIRQSKQLQILVFFTLNQLAIWWFVPPLSTRYALAGFITGLLIVMMWLAKLGYKQSWSKKRLQIIIVSTSLLLLIPRIFVAKRSFDYFWGKQTQQQYIDQLRDSNNTHVLNVWYSGQ